MYICILGNVYYIWWFIFYSSLYIHHISKKSLISAQEKQKYVIRQKDLLVLSLICCFSQREISNECWILYQSAKKATSSKYVESDKALFLFASSNETNRFTYSGYGLLIHTADSNLGCTSSTHCAVKKNYKPWVEISTYWIIQSVAISIGQMESSSNWYICLKKK